MPVTGVLRYTFAPASRRSVGEALTQRMGVGEPSVRLVSDVPDAVRVQAGQVLLDGLFHTDISHVRMPSRCSCAMFSTNEDVGLRRDEEAPAGLREDIDAHLVAGSSAISRCCV